jgi:hypothetical protein
VRMRLGMYPGKRRVQIVHHLSEWSCQRRPPSDEHIIVAGLQPAFARRRRQPYDLPQPAPHPISFDRVTDLSRYGKADTSVVPVAPRARLQHESPALDPHAARSSAKIAPLLQPLDDDGTGLRIKH